MTAITAINAEPTFYIQTTADLCNVQLRQIFVEIKLMFFSLCVNSVRYTI